MTRKKIKLAYISNDTARKATFKKRKRGVLKKVSELSTLCGVEACAIIYSPYNSQPEVWPSAFGVQRVLSQFKNMPDMEQSKKMVNQETFLKHRIRKATEQLKRLRRDNREKEMTRVMFQCLIGRCPIGLNVMDFNDIGWLIDQKMAAICQRMEFLNSATQDQAEIVPYLPAPPLLGDGFDMQRDDAAPPPLMPADNHVFESSIVPMPTEPWFMDMMNPSNGMGFVADDMVIPFGDENFNAIWSNSLFP